MKRPTVSALCHCTTAPDIRSWGAPLISNDVVAVAPLQETLYVGLKDTRMQAFKLPLIMDAPSGAAASDAAVAALDTLADGTLPGVHDATTFPVESIHWPLVT